LANRPGEDQPSEPARGEEALQVRTVKGELRDCKRVSAKKRKTHKGLVNLRECPPTRNEAE